MRIRDPQRNFNMLLLDGITAVKNGNRTVAWSLLTQATQINPLDARPWLWLTETTDDPDEKREYLEQAVAADPRNVAARRGLATLTGKIDQSKVLAEGEGVEVQPSTDPTQSQTAESFLCPKCGAHMEFNINNNKLTCLYCGHVKETEEFSATDAEQVLDFVLPTTSGHRWAASQQQLSCQRCGALSLWPPEQKALQCPYCGSSQLVESGETAELVDPQAIALMNINEKRANQIAKEWLGRGWTAPDDLKQSARKSLLRPAYYPFWTFDGTLDIHWNCEVNEGSSDHPHWVARNGVEFELFDDLLVPGLTQISWKDLNRLSPFNVKDLVEFKPDYLAGWPALTYNRPLAKASLLAREQVVKKVRRELYSRVEVGKQKQNLNTGAVNWSDMTFKHILLPVWVGTYRYQGQNYQILINGQTGKATGEKPRDTLKTVGIVLSVILTIFVIIVFLAILALSMGWIALP
jgi:DNA-directed RNA polymerase subunit RPC12/RpoP